MPTSVQISAYFSYWLNCVDEHSLHSPFFYDFYTKVLRGKSEPFVLAEKLRGDLLQSNLRLEMEELGAGSVLNRSPRQVSDIAKVAISPPKFSALYGRAIEYFNCKTVLELGTSLGINTLYLARYPYSTVHTFEGVASICEIARDTFTFANAGNVRLIEGNIDTTLSTFLGHVHPIDFVFVDANHRYQAAINYFQMVLDAAGPQTILVFDDIHLNQDMEKAWAEIQRHELVHATADLYRCGFVFLDPSLSRQHWVLRF